MKEVKRCIFSGMQILEERKWVTDKALVVEDHFIKAIIPIDMIEHHLPGKIHHFSADNYLIPGLIDLHIHGAHGSDVMDGEVEALTTISRALAKEGVTGFLATTMTASNERIEKVLKAISLASASTEHAAILGVHLEGPFITKAKMGAQRGDDVQIPDPALIKRWQEVAQGAIKLVTLAPELPNALELIHTLHNLDIIVSVGHSDANYAETCAAISAGCTQATHLFNAMRGIHQRDPGATGALLLSNEVTAELIVDGLHLHPAIVDLAFRVKGRDKLLLVTDAVRAKCLGDGKYELGGQWIDVRGEKVTLADGTLAGSMLRMPQAIKNMVQFSHCSLSDAIAMASYNPARALGLEQHKGSIEVGKDADLVVLNADFATLLTMRAGKIIFQQ